MLAAQKVAQLKLVLRNGEQVLLGLVIPLGLLVVLVTLPFIPVDEGNRADFFVPGVLALAVMWTALTGQAIGVGSSGGTGCSSTAAAFWRRAVIWFAANGVTVERVLTDNGSCSWLQSLH